MVYLYANSINLNYIALIEGQGYFFATVMINFKKVYGFKILSLGIILVFLSSNILYAYPEFHRDLLRVPLKYSTPEDNRNRGNIVLSTNDPKSSEIDLVGSKAASLKGLASIPGIKVPKGFNITTKIFDAYLKSVNVHILIAELDSLSEQWKLLSERPEEQKNIENKIENIANEIRHKILSGKLNEDQKSAIVYFYRQLSGKGQNALVAVRSSATAEDMPGASFAGQYETYLNQQGIEQIIEAIKKVWASTYSFNAINYRNKNAISPTETKMAVLILEMVDAQSAGTAFSVDPETGISMISFSNTYGSGEIDVSGKATADAWVFNPETNEILKRRLGYKNLKMVYDPKKRINVIKEVSGEDREKYAIDIQKAHEIGLKLKLIRDHYEKSKMKYYDVEYAVAQDGDIIFLQIRPETAWSKGKLRLVAVDQKKAKDFPVVLEGGISGSVGVSIGVVRIVYSPEEANQIIKSGDIMVAPNTTSVWEYSMGLAVGMITEVGGPSSHTSVVAREQGKPAIVGNPEAINALKPYEGQTVTIDSVFRRVYLGKVPEEFLFHPDKIPAVYLGLDSVTEEQHWEGATKAGQTFLGEDGQKWIGKPNETTSLFLNEIHDKSHHRIAQVAGLNPVAGRVFNGVYAVQFSDIHKWREELRTKNLEELEDMYQKGINIINHYLKVTRELKLTRASVGQWIDAFIGINGFMNITFPLNEAVSGIREVAFSKKRIEEPYLSMAHSSLGPLFGETLVNESLKELGKLLEVLKTDTPQITSLIALLRRVSQGEEGSAQLLKRTYPDFFQQIQDYAKNYRITNEFALSLSAEWPLRKAALDLIKSYDSGRRISIFSQMPEEYYPDDKEFSRIARLAELLAKVKQDAHHIKFRAQWKFMEVLDPFCEYLKGRGIIKEKAEVFDHKPEWLLDRLEEFENERPLKALTLAEGFRMKSYKTFNAEEAKDMVMIAQGTLEEIIDILQEQGVSRSDINNLREGYERAWSVIINRYPDQKKALGNLMIRITNQDGVSKPEAAFLSININAMCSSEYMTQIFLRGFDQLAVCSKNSKEKAVESLITDIEEVLFFLSLSTEEKSSYLLAMLRSRFRQSWRGTFLNVLIQVIESPQELEQIVTNLSQHVGSEFGDLQELRNIYEQRDEKISIFDKVLNYANDISEYSELQLPELQKNDRLAMVSKIFSENLIFLKGLWKAKSSDSVFSNFYRSLLQEAKTSGVSPSLIVIGLINLNQKDHLVDDMLLRRRWQLTFESTPVDFVFVGGGGFNSGTISRSARWVRDHEYHGIYRDKGYDSANVTTTWDRGGSSQKDADAVRNKYKTHVMSPGDNMTVLSFQSITDTNWFKEEDRDSLWQSSFKPEDLDAVMDLIYTYRNRLVVPKDRTLEDVVVERILDVYNNDKLAKPDNWQEFIVNFRAAARVIDRELINQGYLQEIRDQRTSTQNLIMMALVVAFNMDAKRASREIHYILGLRKTFALPASFEDAILGMRLEAPNGKTNDEIIGHLNFANERDVYLKGKGEESYRGKPYQMVLKSGEDVDTETRIEDVAPDKFPKANSDAVEAIKNCQRALIMGMSSPFDSTLSNLMLKDVVDAMKTKVKEGTPSFYFPKVITELQTEGLTLKEILEIWERSIRYAQGDNTFRIEDIITHVFMPRVPEDLWDICLQQLKNEKKYLLNEAGQEELKMAKTMSSVRDIFFEKKYWNDETKRKVNEGWIKISKMIPGVQFVFNEEDRKFLESRGIKIVEAEETRQERLYRIWEQRVVYNTNEVVRIIDRAVWKNRGGISDNGMTTLLNPNLVDKVVKLGGQVIRDFLRDLGPYVGDPENSPFSDISRFDNLWEAAKQYREKGADAFNDEVLLKESKGIPRIEVRGHQRNDGSAAQVAIIGVPGVYRVNIIAAFDKLVKGEGLNIGPGGGPMTIEANQDGVDKALAIEYIGRHFNDILDQIGYIRGEFIDARKTRTMIISDADSTIYGSPTKTHAPILNESPTRKALIEYLRAGGLLVVNSGNDLELVVKRLLEKEGIPRDLRCRVVVVGNGGANMALITEDGKMVNIEDYRFNALKEKAEQSRDKILEGFDVVYIGDDAREEGSDFKAFEKVGFRRSVTVTKEELENIPKGLKPNYVGGLENGTRIFLEKVVERAKLKPFQKLFNITGMQSIIAETRIPLTSLEVSELKEIMEQFSKHMKNRVIDGNKSSLAMEPAYIAGSTGMEKGEYISVDWGGTNLRVIHVKLVPGQKPEVLKSFEMKFTIQHKTGKIDPFKTIAEQIAKLGVNSKREYGLGFTFSQPVEQISLNSGRLRQWVKGWSIPNVGGKDVSQLLQEAINREGISNIKVKSLLNDVVATHLAVPNADIGLILGTGFTFSMLDENGQIINTEAGGFIYDGLPQTIYDRNIYQNIDPINEHAFEKMLSGAYLGTILRMHLRALRDQGKFMSDHEIVSFIDEPEKLQITEFEKEDNLRALIEAIQADVRYKLHSEVVPQSSLEESLNWVIKGPIIFKLFDKYQLESYLTKTGLELYNKVKTQYNINSLSALSNEQAFILAGSIDGQKLQRIILGLIYANLMPNDGPDIFWTKLISLIEQYNDLGSLREALSNEKQLGLSDISDSDIKTLQQLNKTISKRAGRLVAAVILAAIEEKDPFLSKNHIVAVDGSVYQNHPRMRQYIDDGIAELRLLNYNDQGGHITFELVKDASGVGAAIAAAIASGEEKILQKDRATLSDANEIDKALQYAENRLDL